MPSVEEKIDRIEKLLTQVLDRLEKLENFFKALGISELDIIFDLVSSLTIPIQQAVKSAKTITYIVSRYGISDSITKTILEILAIENGLSITEITRRVKEIRGRASRRIVASKIRYLESIGVVRTQRRGSATKVYLVKHGEEEKSG
ncbi:MAG: hypothetical protein QXF10_09295 [Ignisphaera sp.]